MKINLSNKCRGFFRIKNIWKYNLPDAWRLFYSIEGKDLVSSSIVLVSIWCCNNLLDINPIRNPAKSYKYFILKFIMADFQDTNGF